MMIETLADGGDGSVDFGEIADPAVRRVRLAFERHLRCERMAVDARIGMALLRSRKKVSGVETEFFGDGDHDSTSVTKRIPRKAAKSPRGWFSFFARSAVNIS